MKLTKVELEKLISKEKIREESPVKVEIISHEVLSFDEKVYLVVSTK